MTNDSLKPYSEKDRKLTMSFMDSPNHIGMSFMDDPYHKMTLSASNYNCHDITTGKH